MSVINDELLDRFTYHELNKDQIECCEQMRRCAMTFAVNVVLCCPENRERSLAITKIEEAMMWANAAIDRREDG